MSKATFLLILACLLGLPPLVAPAESQKPDTKRERERTEWEQGLAKLKREDPARFEAETRWVIFLAQYTLATLGYGIGPFTGVLDEKTRDAVGEYQKVNGFTATGEPWEFNTL